MKTTPFYRRRPLLSSLLLLLVTVVILLVVLLSQLDLVRFRHHLTVELSRILQQPVGIGKLNLTYQQGLAVEVHNLGIGDEKDLDIRIPLLTAVLRLHPLLHGEFLLDRVIVTEPQIRLAVSDSVIKHRRETAPSKAGEMFDTFGMSLLTIRRAQLFLIQDDPSLSHLPARIDNLNLVLRDWGTGKSGFLVVSGELPEGKSLCTIESELPPPAELANWRQLPLDIKTDLKHVPRNLLPEKIRKLLPEFLDLNLRLQGALSEGVEVNATVKNSATGRQMLTADGRWTSQKQLELFEQLHLEMNDLQIQGRLLIDHTTEDPQWQGRLSSRNLTLPRLLKTWGGKNLNKLTAGTVRSAEIVFSGPLKKPGKRSETDFQYQANAVLENGRWDLSDTYSLEQVALNIELNREDIQLTAGKARLLGQAVSFSGEIHNWKNTPVFHLNAAADLDTADIRHHLQKSLPAPLQFSGPARTTLELDGSRERIRGELHLALDEVTAEYRSLLNKPAGLQAGLTLKGSWQPGQLNIEQATLATDSDQLQAGLKVPLSAAERPVQLELSIANLAVLSELSPLLQKMRAQGGLKLDLLYRDAGNFHGNIYLDNTGAHLTRLISDINAANGSVSFDHLGLDFSGVTARLGRSPVLLDGRLRNWKNFLLDLRVRGEVVSARDLVFANTRMLIQDLDGHLLINKGGIVFDPVTVKLEDGTDASVQGYVRNFSDPDTYLEIESKGYANILSIIRLFNGPPKERPAKNTRRVKPIRIQARAAKGTLGGLNFQQAEGTIVSSKGLFTLSPLRFQHKDGYCLSKVEYDQGRLKISGHLENFDASVLHSETLKTAGLINGTLRGDFYLEGTGTGDEFWATSKGGSHLEVRDGVLRKFRGLAQIFSLLNVSQLFSLQLPDMDRDGMPFSKLIMSTRLNDGVLSTTNTHITSNAMNMSLIGRRNIVEDTVNLTVGVKPLRTVDKIITAIPVAGWLLAGEERALLTAHFRVKGPARDPKVTAIPVSSLSKTVLGLLKRTLGLPGTLITEPEKLFPDPQGTIPPEQGPGEQTPSDSAPKGTGQ